MDLKKGLYKILYDDSEIDLSQKEEAHIEQLLNQYCQGSLDEPNTKKINLLIQENEDLAQEIANYKIILGGVETFFMQKSVSNAAQNYFQEEQSKSGLKVIFNNTNNRNPRFWIGWSTAAAVLLLIVFFVFPKSTDGTLTATDLYKKYNQEQLSLTLLGVENEAIRLANQSYRSSDYSEAVKHFEKHFHNSINEPLEAYLCYGISLYQQAKADNNKAIDIFKQIINADNYYSNLARWHLALLHLKTNNQTQAKQILEELLPLTEAGSSRRNDVKDILTSLK